MEQIDKNLAGTTAGLGSDFGTLGAVVAEVNTRTGATGETLENFSSSVLQLSRLTGGDAVSNTRLLTRVMGDWGVTVEDSTQLMDSLFGAGQATGIGFESLAEKLVSFGAPLRQFGFSVEESIALFGKWELEGVNTELVLGSLKIAMAKFAEAGIPLREGLEDTIATIQELGPGAEAVSLAMEVFGRRAGPDMAAAILEGKFEIEELVETIQGMGGSLEDAANRSVTFGERLEVMQKRAMIAIMPIGEMFLALAERILPKLEPVITAVVDTMGVFFTSVQSGLSPVEILWDTLESLGFASDELWTSLVAADTAVRGFMVSAMAIIEPIAAWVSENVKLSDVLTAVGIAILSFVVPALISMLLAALPIVLAIVALIAIVALLRTAWEENWGGIQEKTAAAIEFVKGVISEGLAAIQAWWAENGADITAKVEEVWTTVSERVGRGIEVVKTFISKGLASIRTWWAENGETVIATVEQMWDNIVTNHTNAIASVVEVVTVALDTIKTWWSKHGENTKTIVSEFLKNVTEFFTNQLSFVMGIVSGAIKAITGDWEGAKEIWGTTIAAAWEVIKNIFQTGVDNAKGIISNVDWSAVGNSIVTGITTGLQNAWGNLKNVLTELVGGLLDAAMDALLAKSPSRLFSLEVGEIAIGGGIILGLENVKNDVNAAMAGLVAPMADIAIDAAMPSARFGSPMANGGGGGNSYSANTTVNVAAGDDPLRALRAARLLDALGA
jgi:phage-related minor tail protein